MIVKYVQHKRVQVYILWEYCFVVLTDAADSEPIGAASRRDTLFKKFVVCVQKTFLRLLICSLYYFCIYTYFSEDIRL
jgi:hypothetical protein